MKSHPNNGSTQTPAGGGCVARLQLPVIVLSAMVLLALALPTGSSAQVTVFGTIVDADQPGQSIPFVNVRVDGTTRGVAADARGEYDLQLEAGTHTLVYSAVGYKSHRETLTLGSRLRVRKDIALKTSVHQSEGLVVTGTMTEVSTSDSPVKVSLLPSRFLETVPTANVMEVIDRVNGLYQQIDCGVCYTNNIRINGVDGPNTAVLIDGMPVMSSLATVYGLNGISPMLIKQVEVVKGPMSTLYGSEALGGVVNIRTKDPGTTPLFSANIYTTQHREHVAEVSAVALRGRDNVLVSGTLLSATDYHDNNGDGFSDRPFQERLALFSKYSRKDRFGFQRGSLVAKWYQEDRNAGTAAFLERPEALRGSDRIYGEAILTRRAELIGMLNVTPSVKLEAAGSVHDQDSYYGDSAYLASQQDGFLQGTWTPFMPDQWDDHGILVGAAMRVQRYDDASGVTGDYDEEGNLIENRPDTRLIPGLFVQDDWEVSASMRALTGLRIDYQPEHGWITSPRVALKWSVSDLTALRLNAGTGFRVVNLFTEDHAAYTGGRATVILEELDPERSLSTTAAVQHVLTGLGSPITLDLDAFWTRFSNKIEPDYDTPGQVRYRNLDGYYQTRGFAAQVQGTLPGSVSYSVGGTWMDVDIVEDGIRSPHEFAPSFQGTATITWNAPGGMVLDYTARVVGPMKLPDYDAATRADYLAATGKPLYSTSPTYAVHNVQMTRDIRGDQGRLIQIYAAIENVLGYRQSSPLIGFHEGNPGFADSFDTAYVYGPIEGRHVGVGVRAVFP